MFKKTTEYSTSHYKDKELTILHREDGPAIECASGTKHWYLNNKKHREDGPAIEGAKGTKEWYLNGKRHRIDGPAIEYSDGYKSWFLYDKKYYNVTSNEYWINFTKSLILL